MNKDRAFVFVRDTFANAFDNIWGQHNPGFPSCEQSLTVRLTNGSQTFYGGNMVEFSPGLYGSLNAMNGSNPNAGVYFSNDGWSFDSAASDLGLTRIEVPE